MLFELFRLMHVFNYENITFKCIYWNSKYNDECSKYFISVITNYRTAIYYKFNNDNSFLKFEDIRKFSNWKEINPA